MADELVRKEHFDEYVLRMDERFLGIEKRMEQGFAHAEKAREQDLVQGPDYQVAAGVTADATPGRCRAGSGEGYLTAIGLPGEPVAPFRRSGEKM